DRCCRRPGEDLHWSSLEFLFVSSLRSAPERPGGTGTEPTPYRVTVGCQYDWGRRIGRRLYGLARRAPPAPGSGDLFAFLVGHVRNEGRRGERHVWST